MVLLYISCGVILINCSYYLYFSRFSFFKEPPDKTNVSFPVSVIVCAKNEGKSLQKHIPLWLNQTYPKFQLVLINDTSVDDTLEIFNHFAQQDSRIKVVDVKNNESFWGNKKYALTLGIKAAAHQHLIFTDADCAPASPHWIQLMANKFSKKNQLVLGYGGYYKEKGLLNKLIRFETVLTALQYFSYALNGNPYMGVGRNLAYTTSLYYENKGFMSHIKIPSGDDDLFVNEAANASNTTICISPEAYTYSAPKYTFKDWVQQKKRHYTTSKYYKFKHKFSLGLFHLATILFWVFASLALTTTYWQIALGIIAFRLLFQYFVYGKAAQRLKEKDLILLIPLLEIFLIFIQLHIFISNKESSNIKWK